MSGTACEYLVEPIWMPKAFSTARRPSLSGLTRSISSADGSEVGSKDMMGASYCCLIQPGSVSGHSTSLRKGRELFLEGM
jgi:hypothetical protein